MTRFSPATNLQTYDKSEVAAHYASLDHLTPGERLLFETYIQHGSAILDLGVGGGRTTTFLANRGSRYVGVDYADAMVGACRAKFPTLEFVLADAADLSAFPDSSFDAVVFAFNGLDYVLPGDARLRCFDHIRRILKTGGIFIFSSHNAGAFLVRVRWNRGRVRQMAYRVSAGASVLYWPVFVALAVGRAALAAGLSLAATVPRLIRRLPSRTFWNGEGNFIDSSHGGLLTHAWTPQCVVAEVVRFHFKPLRVVGEEYPMSSHRFTTDWYYYVFAKTGDR